jgi:hypothetical protein
MKPDTKMLLKRGKYWHINGRCPKRLGGGLFRFSLQTSDMQQARYIRDRYIQQIRDVETIEAALEVIQSRLMENQDKIKRLRKELRLKK